MIENELDLEHDYSTAFIRTSITDLKNDGICYVFTESQAKNILLVIPDAKIKKNECGYTLTLKHNSPFRAKKKVYPRKKKEV